MITNLPKLVPWLENLVLLPRWQCEKGVLMVNLGGQEILVEIFLVQVEEVRDRVESNPGEVVAVDEYGHVLDMDVCQFTTHYLTF